MSMKKGDKRTVPLSPPSVAICTENFTVNVILCRYDDITALVGHSKCTATIIVMVGVELTVLFFADKTQTVNVEYRIAELKRSQYLT